MKKTLRATCALLIVLLVAAASVQTQAPPKVTSPKEQFGHEIGADYVLPNYSQLTAYWQKLDKESDRIVVQSIGKTAEGRDQWMAIISAPENFKKLDRYKEIAKRLALAEGLTDDQARALAAEGKSVVWIDGGLHATEVLGAQQLMELVYQMVSRTDPETMRILRDDILLAVHANPDGMELVSNWYMREKEPTRRSTGGLPRLYQKYIGHDNNRDFYMSAQPESANINRIHYQEWFPQIVYNHHQTGPAGAVLFAAPFRDPFNYNFDPLVPLGIDMVGAAIHGRFAAEGKPGATMRRGASYSTWFNGGLRTTTYFHNMIGILTETIGNPTPIRIPFVLQKQLPNGDLPYPIAPQEWHFRQSIEYSITANRAILDLASKHREDLLFNIYRMGKNSIERGSRDSWTVTPKKIEAVQAAITSDQQAARGQVLAGGGRGGGGGGRGGGDADPKYFQALHDPKLRDPRGFILPSDQPDFLTATKFVNALIKAGITVHRATGPFDVAGKKYPAGSFVVKTAQAFRPHVLDMFEPQDHPNDFQYPGGPPIPPYDTTGYTLAFQMGVKFDRIPDGFDGPFERLSGLQKPPASQVAAAPANGGYLLSHQTNDAFVAVNRLLKANDEVFWLKEPVSIEGASQGPGTMYVTAKASTLPVLQKAAADLGLKVQPVAGRPAGDALRLRPVRVGLWDRYGGSMPSGWTRWLFEQYEFPFEVVYPQTLDAGDLKSKFDVLVFVSGAIPEGPSTGSGQAGGGRGGVGGEVPEGGGFGAPTAENVPPEFRGWLGSVTVDKTIPQLRKFVEDGGTLVTIGSSATAVARHFGLPVGDALVEKTAEGERSLPRERFFVPGSVLRAAVDNTNPLAYGMSSQVDVFFDSSPAFELAPSAAMKGVRAVAWYDGPSPLRSGWAWGQHYLEGGIAAIEAPVGRGKVFLFGPEIAFRGQPHGTFKFLFNAIYYGPAQAAGAGRQTEQQN
jgi:hypothetical protein